MLGCDSFHVSPPSVALVFNRIANRNSQRAEGLPVCNATRPGGAQSRHPSCDNASGAVSAKLGRGRPLFTSFEELVPVNAGTGGVTGRVLLHRPATPIFCISLYLLRSNIKAPSLIAPIQATFQPGLHQSRLSWGRYFPSLHPFYFRISSSGYCHNCPGSLWIQPSPTFITRIMIVAHPTSLNRIAILRQRLPTSAPEECSV